MCFKHRNLNLAATVVGTFCKTFYPCHRETETTAPRPQMGAVIEMGVPETASRQANFAMRSDRDHPAQKRAGGSFFGHARELARYLSV